MGEQGHTIYISDLAISTTFQTSDIFDILFSPPLLTRNRQVT
jgi:hypothetical protein